MRTQALLVAAFLGGCCMGGAAPPTPPPSIAPAPPSSIAPPSAPVVAGPTGPTAPGCPDLQTAILGTWQRTGFVEEYRAGGVYVLNGVEGTITWMRPGHALLDVPTAHYHAECDFALADEQTLVTAEPGGVGNVYARTSAPIAAPPACFDISTAWAGAWVPGNGGPVETYQADGHYAAPGTGTWSFTAPGRLHLVSDTGVMSDYVVGLSSPTTALAVSLPPLSGGVAYTRQP